MKVGIISDIHDQWTHLDTVLSQMKVAKVKELVVLGDLCSPPTLERIGQSDMQVTCIYGNNDGDRARMAGIARQFGKRMVLAEDEFLGTNIDGKRVFLTHYPEIGAAMAETGEYQAVFYGHNHTLHWETLANGAVLVNPGEVWGYKTGVVSFGLWDSDSNGVEVIEVR